MDISTTLSLNWSDIEDDIVNERYVEVEGKQYGPCIFLQNLVREKEKVQYSTAIYKTGQRYLTTYLKERFGEDIVAGIKEYVREYNKRAEEWSKKGSRTGEFSVQGKKISIATVPLFVGREGERHISKYVLEMLRDIAPKTDIVNSRFFKADINPLGSHSLGASWNNRLSNAGMPQDKMKIGLTGHTEKQRKYLKN